MAKTREADGVTVIQWIVAAIGTGGIGKFLWDGVTAFTQRGKNKTESAVILLNSATGYSSKIEARLDSVNEKFDEFRREQERRNQENDRRWRQQDQLLLAHARWDHHVVAHLKAKGVPVEEPPPLFLPVTPEGTTA